MNVVSMSRVSKRPGRWACVIGAAMIASTQAMAQSQPPAAAPSKPKPAPQVSAIRTQAAVASAGKTQGETKPQGDVVAHIGGVDITAKELRAYVEGLGAREQAAIAKEPALLGQAVRLMLNERVVLQEALAKKWEQQPQVAAALEQLRERAIVELYLKSVSQPPASFPSEEELQKAYDANRSAFVVPRQFQLGHIFVKSPKDADRVTEDRAKKALEEIARKLKTGAEFAAIARADSDAKDGGELGWLIEGQIRPEIRARVMGLSKGAVSEPIQLDDGWHIVKLIDTKASYTRPLAEARDQLAQQMRTERATALRRAYVAELVKRNPPVVNEIALSNLLDGVRK
jgi:parvulin-like peptidyl-prolyl isomerase